MTWLTKEADGDSPMEQALGVLPDVEEAVREFYALFWAEGLVDPVTLELVRLRIAMLHESPGEQLLRFDAAVEAGLTEEKIAALAAWPTSPLYTDHERAVLRVAEQFVIDPHGVTDEDVAPLKAALGSDGLVALMNTIGFTDHLNRIRIALDVPPVSDVVVTVPAPTASGTLY